MAKGKTKSSNDSPVRIASQREPRHSYDQVAGNASAASVPGVRTLFHGPTSGRRQNPKKAVAGQRKAARKTYTPRGR